MNNTHVAICLSHMLLDYASSNDYLLVLCILYLIPAASQSLDSSHGSPLVDSTRQTQAAFKYQVGTCASEYRSTIPKAISTLNAPPHTRTWRLTGPSRTHHIPQPSIRTLFDHSRCTQLNDSPPVCFISTSLSANITSNLP